MKDKDSGKTSARQKGRGKDLNDFKDLKDLFIVLGVLVVLGVLSVPSASPSHRS